MLNFLFERRKYSWSRFSVNGHESIRVLTQTRKYSPLVWITLGMLFLLESTMGSLEENYPDGFLGSFFLIEEKVVHVKPGIRYEDMNWWQKLRVRYEF